MAVFREAIDGRPCGRPFSLPVHVSALPQRKPRLADLASLK
jgi:hypothetical protein